MADLARLVTRSSAPQAPVPERCRAFGELVRRFQDMAYGCALGVLGDAHLAEDAAQEAFIAAWQNLAHLRKPEAFPGWLRRIVLWQCHRLSRGRHVETIPLDLTVHDLRDGADPQSDLERAELDQVIREAIRALPERERQVTVLYYMGEHTQREIAQFLELPVGTVKKRLYDARQKLKAGMLVHLARELRGRAPSSSDKFGGKTMKWIRPDNVTSEYDGFMRGHGIQVWDMLRASAEGDLKKVKALLKADPGLANCEFAYFRPLHFAVREGHVKLVKLLLGAGADPTYRGYLSWQKYPLIQARDRGLGEIAALVEEALQVRFQTSQAGQEICEAVRAGEAAEVRALLERDSELVNAGDEKGNRPLHCAVEANRLDLVDLLLEKGADINAVRSDGFKPIHCAIYRNFWWGRRRNPLLPGYLIAKGADYNISIAAALGDMHRVRELLEEDPSLANFEDTCHKHPLSSAAQEGYTEIVKLLLEHGADPNAPEANAPRGYALYGAVAGDHLECVRLLLEHGADADARVESSGNPLERAIGNPFVGDRHKKEIADLLFAYGGTAGADHYAMIGRVDVLAELLKVDPSLANSGGDYGVLCMAAGFAPIEVVKLLLRYNADLNRPWYANNYMDYACRLRTPDRLEVVKLLLERGADPNLTNWLGVSYLHVQAMKGREEVVRLLLDYGADIHARDDEYRSTPLGWAARWGQKEMVELLLSRGAKTNLPDDAPWATPLAWAERKSHTEIAEVLRKHGATA